ncbi:MAG TPA: UbiA family prenyltransferase, partial [Kofleriaceae bacterium]|nr:UbiA family prenyltransferase [Kofleriaceae bacterium]
IAVVAFCALSGAVYAFNDVKDVAADRVHPTKRNRPIASGQLSERAALILASVLAAAALTACTLLSWETGAWAAGYLVVNLSYSLWLKHVAFVDVLLIASGFIARVGAGGSAGLGVGCSAGAAGAAASSASASSASSSSSSSKLPPSSMLSP